jgi:hypothetical protein
MHLSFRFSKLIPVTFMTGFYVANVVSRYWDQFLSLPWPDRLAYKLVSYVPGQVNIYSFIIQQKPLNVITLGQRKTDNINKKITKSETPKGSLLKVIKDLANLVQLDQINRIVCDHIKWLPQ